MTMGEAKAQIAVIEQQAMVMGANDFELGAFRNIHERLDGGRLSPEEAVKEALAILNAKMDYR